MSPEAIAACAGLLVAWLEFRAGLAGRTMETRMALVEYRLGTLEGSVANMAVPAHDPDSPEHDPVG